MAPILRGMMVTEYRPGVRREVIGPNLRWTALTAAPYWLLSTVESSSLSTPPSSTSRYLVRSTDVLPSAKE